MARERYNWLDIMKLIAIWLMYITHYDGMGRFGILGLYSVLGILFFSSGFTAFTRKDHPLPEFIKGKFISIMVPYFAFCFLTLAIRAFMLEMSVGEIIAWTRGILSGVRNQVPLAAMWFMPCWRMTARRTASMSFAGSTLRGQRSTQAKQLRQV